MAGNTPPGKNEQQRSVREQVDRILISAKRGLAFWKRSLLVFMACAGIALAVTFLAARAYRSETVVLYQESMSNQDLTGGEGRGDNARRVGARLKEVLLSRATLEPLVKEMQLYPEIVERRGLVDAVDEMRKHLTFRAREGDTFEIAFESDTPQRAQEITSRLAGCIVQEASSRRTEQAKTLKEFLDAESERNKVDLRVKEADLAKFLALHPDFARPTTSDLHTAPLAGPGSRSVSTGDPLLSALEWKAAQIDRQLRAAPGEVVPSTPKPSAPPPKLPDSGELAAAKRDVDDKASRYTEKHPDVIAARARLRAAEAAQVVAQQQADAAYLEAQSKARRDEAPVKPATEENRELLTKQLADLRAQAAARRAQLGAGAATIPAAPDRSAGSPTPTPASQGGAVVDLEVEFRRLQREATDARDRQRQLDEKQFKASITASSVMNDRNIQVSVLDPAFLPTHPSSKPRSTLLGIGLLAALVVAFLTALVSARLDDRVYDRVDLEFLDVMPVVGVIPRPKALPRKSA